MGDGMALVECPRCGGIFRELFQCSDCHSIGCARCLDQLHSQLTKAIGVVGSPCRYCEARKADHSCELCDVVGCRECLERLQHEPQLLEVSCPGVN